MIAEAPMGLFVMNDGTEFGPRETMYRFLRDDYASVRSGHGVATKSSVGTDTMATSSMRVTSAYDSCSLSCRR